MTHHIQLVAQLEGICFGPRWPQTDYVTPLFLLLCRGPALVRPLFLAAPGVANAQSAYFSFSRYLAWSTQPIYVLEKDDALNIAQLARRNAGGDTLCIEEHTILLILARAEDSECISGDGNFNLEGRNCISQPSKIIYSA